MKNINKRIRHHETFQCLRKRAEDCMDAVEEAGSPCTDMQIINKVFSFDLKEDFFMMV